MIVQVVAGTPYCIILYVPTFELLAKLEDVVVRMLHLEVKLDGLQQDALVCEQLLLQGRERLCTKDLSTD